MTGFSLYLYEDFQIAISEGLVISLDSTSASNVAKWAINSIAHLQNGEHFETSQTGHFKAPESEIKPLEVDQSNLSFQYGNYLIKVKKELNKLLELKLLRKELANKIIKNKISLGKYKDFIYKIALENFES